MDPENNFENTAGDESISLMTLTMRCGVLAAMIFTLSIPENVRDLLLRDEICGSQSSLQACQISSPLDHFDTDTATVATTCNIGMRLFDILPWYGRSLSKHRVDNILREYSA